MAQGVYVGSPTIWKMPNGSCLAAHDFFGHTTLNSTVQVFVDHTGRCAGPAARWEYAGNVTGMYWANLFAPVIAPAAVEQPGVVYLFGVSDGDHAKARSIVISSSRDYGRTWSRPSVLVPDLPGGGLVYHCAPTPVLTASDGRLYRAFEVYHNYTAVMIRTRQPYAGAGADLLSPGTWELSAPLTFDPKYYPTGWTGHFGWQEGNAVEGPDGGIYDILRIDGQTPAVHNKAAVVQVGGSGAEFGRLSFDRIIDFPSTSSKFTIRRHPVSKKYYALSTDVTPAAVAGGWVYARNHLVLAQSDNLWNWTTCGTLLSDDTGMPPADSARYTGFHYVDWVFDSDDILYSVRAGYRGSNTFHNANRLLVKRLPSFATVCAAAGQWRERYKLIGAGWCRPTDGWRPSGTGLTDAECAAACTGAGSGCDAFANNASDACALYPDAATTTSNGGDPKWGVQCYAKLGGGRPTRGAGREL